MAINSALLAVGTLFLCAQLVAEPPSLRLIGHYSNQKTYLVSGDPHSEGYSLTLYRSGKTVVGEFCMATGIEVPCAPLAHATHKGSRLQFDATIPVGTEISNETGASGRQAYRRLTFKGSLSKGYVKGILTSKNGSVTAEVLRLRRIKDSHRERWNR
mgnify:CR=1 FL=1